MDSTNQKSGAAVLRVAMIVLLVVLTLANGLGLAIGIVSWVEEVDHGAEFADPELRAAVGSTLLSVVALAAIGGAWARRKWGPRLYVATQVFGLLFLLVAAADAVTPINVVPLVLAGVLWWQAERDW